MTVDLRTGDSLEILKTLDADSIDSVVTDPPYGLSFMGKKWDYDVPTTELWKEVIRVLKPGGHLLSFSSSRTYHRMAVAVEDAGFEIRDQIMWVYGSGFPKSHNIGKSYDKKVGNERVEVENIDPKTGKAYAADRSATATWDKNVIGGWQPTDASKRDKGTSPYEGWGTALKPAHEPIVLARKPFKGTVVDNVIKHGTGGINIDKSRVSAGKDDVFGGGVVANSIMGQKCKEPYKKGTGFQVSTEGRFPANFLHDGSDEVVKQFPTVQKSTNYTRKKKRDWNAYANEDPTVHDTEPTLQTGGRWEAAGSAARFFYCAKVSKSERNAGCEDFDEKISKDNSNRKLGSDFDTVRTQTGKNNHPTVKPVKLMSYLVNLVTPEGGIVLDPFMGSGSTGMACKQEGFDFIGIDLDESYVEIAKARIDGWKNL